MDIHNDTPGQSEDALQQKCYYWYWNTFPHRRGLLFSVPNGGGRNAREGKKFKQTGLVAGVSDMILLVNGKAFFLELKKDELAVQSPKQVIWEVKVRTNGFHYSVVRSLGEFKKLVTTLIEINK